MEYDRVVRARCVLFPFVQRLHNGGLIRNVKVDLSKPERSHFLADAALEVHGPSQIFSASAKAELSHGSTQDVSVCMGVNAVRQLFIADRFDDAIA